MRIKCNNIISPITKEEMGDKSPWLTKDREYVVLALEINDKRGIDVCIQTDHYNEPSFIPLDGFEVVSQKIPLSWITVVNNIEDRKFLTMLPKSWNYNSFFEDLDDENLDAIALFNKEVELIYKAEGMA